MPQEVTVMAMRSSPSLLILVLSSVLIMFSMVSCPSEIEQHFTITFDAQDGTAPSSATKEVTPDSAYGTLPTTTKPGHTFRGWWTAADGAGTEVTDATVFNGTENQTLYAKWTFDVFTGPAGGFVFYENPNHAVDGWRYLEAAPVGWNGQVDDSSWQFIFGYYRTTENGTNQVVGTGTAIGTGAANTIAITSAMGADTYTASTGSTKNTYYAAKACADYAVGAFDDWFLPSKDELNLMYKNLTLQDEGELLSNQSYRSSSEFSNDKAWVQSLGSSGLQSNGTNNAQYINVRPIRAYQQED
jgi:uncharacterized repeat protein (TIGR02543 family)